MKKIELSNELTEQIIKDYTVNCLSLTQIGKNYNLSRTVITRVMKENGIETNVKPHKYHADYNKFENIDSIEKAYWLGFLMADGCNYQREHNASVIINISYKDIDHLKKFKEFMNTDAEIVIHTQTKGYSNNSQMCKITLNSQKLSKDLADKGVVPRKSLIASCPKIEEQFFKPFILGYFDGDGSIFKSSNNEYGFNLEGTKEMLEWIKQELKLDVKLEKRYQDDKNNYYIRCGGTNKPYQVLKQLYDSSDVKLDRKFKIYKELETVVLNRNIK